MDRSNRRLLVVIFIAVALAVALLVVMVALRRSKSDDATYRVRLFVQALPPCAIDVLVPVPLDERYLPDGKGETPFAASLFERNATEWDSVTGDLTVLATDGLVERATFEADDGRRLELSRPVEEVALERPADHC